MEIKMKILIENIAEDQVTIKWEPVDGATGYVVFWADKDSETVEYREMGQTTKCEYTLHKATHVPHYLKVAARKENITYFVPFIIVRKSILRIF